MKRIIIAAIMAVFLVACGGDHSDHDHAQPVETVTVYAEPEDVPDIDDFQYQALEEVWAQQTERDRDIVCLGMAQFGMQEAYEQFSEGAGGYLVDYPIFVDFFQSKCQGYGV